MSTYPAYIHRLLAQAYNEGQWYAGQADAAALCFEILALFPDNREAADLVYELFCDEWLIYDNRNALQQHIDEWDDRPWQQRRRLALSFRFMSRWEGWHREYEEGYEHEREGPIDVIDLLEKGHDRLLTAYCLGDDEATNYAWSHFAEACCQTNDVQAALFWVGKQYADLGFFADAADVLTELCVRFNDKSAYRLLAEVRWWRDNAHRIPWLPPPGDGSRYKRMMRFIDPDAPDDEEIIQQLRTDLGLSESVDLSMALNPDLASVIASAMSTLPAEPAPHEVHVDWSFLDTDDGRPGELPKWAKRMARLLPADIADDIVRRHRWSRPIQPPATPPRHNPYEPPFDPGEFLP
jgi:hypothetical protein